MYLGAVFQPILKDSETVVDPYLLIGQSDINRKRQTRGRQAETQLLNQEP